MGMILLRFTTTIGEEKQEIPIEVPGTTRMSRTLAEIAKKLNIDENSLTVAPMGGVSLVASEYNMTVDEISQKYGVKFSIINKGIVG